MARVFAHDRRCSRPGCITVLCAYNPGPLCFVHDAQATTERLARDAVERVEAIDLMLQEYGVGERVAA